MITIRRARTQEIIDLRHLVLRSGRPRHTAFFDGDARARHWAAVEGGRVTGCVSLMPTPDPEGLAGWQLRGMAVHPELQGRGLGRSLLAAVDAEVPESIWCNARTSAAGFYLGLGWEQIGEPFVIEGIGPHIRMRRTGTSPHALLGAGRFLQLESQAGWEVCRRRSGHRVVGVVATDTEGRLLLVEQHRPPVGGPVIELPAGLWGDEDADEPALAAAQRELLEECGHGGGTWTRLADCPASAGMTDESMVLFAAVGVHRISDGGGVAGEDIRVHAVPQAEVMDFLRKAGSRGCSFDGRVPSALAWLHWLRTQ